MKNFFRTIGACLALLGLSVHAAPIVQSGWTTTGVAATARNAMGVPAETNGTLYGTVGFGGLTLPSLVNIYGTNQFWDVTGSTSAKLWFMDPYFEFGQSISTPGINLNGVFRTTWPSGGAGSGSPFTNIVVKTADNNPDPAQGAALILRPQEVLAVAGGSAVYQEILPAYTNNAFKGMYRFINHNSTVPFDDPGIDVVYTWGYNFGGNSAGISTYGLTDTNEPIWMSQRESRWQNAGGSSQLEWWDAVGTPYTAFGTNFFVRHETYTPIWNTATKALVRLEAKHTVSTHEWQNPTTTNGIFGFTLQSVSALRYSFNGILRGQLSIETNDVNNGVIAVKGGQIQVGVPDTVTANNMLFRMDYANQLGIQPHAAIYSSGTSKALHFSIPNVPSNQFTNHVFNNHVQIDGMMVLNSNATSTVWTHPNERGQVAIWNSNGIPYMLTASLATLTWASTQQLVGASSGGGYSGWETNAAFANGFKSTNDIYVLGVLYATNGAYLGPIMGATNGGNAVAGAWGEYASSAIASGSAVSLTDATAANITSISLTAGDWDVEGNVNLIGTGATFTEGAAGISTTTATLPTDGTETFTAGDLTGNFTEGMTVSRKRINVTVTTTVYLVGRATFSAGTVIGYGSITARRVAR
jgi:hypothetical protein